jgi:hypothetical protein
MLIKVDLPKDPNKKIAVEAYTVNHELGPKIAWHLKRFIPFMEFKNQPTILVDEVDFLIDEEGNEITKIEKDIYKYSDAGSYLSQFKLELTQLEEALK